MKSFLTRLQGIALALLALSPASPAADSMTTAASITDARMVHNAALLPDGRVLVAGGGVTDTIADAGVIFSTQVFDPVMGAWSTVSSDSLRRKRATATLLPDGRVLCLGGVVFVGASPAGFGNGSGSIYNPVSDTWTSGGGLSGGFRFSHATVSLLDGRVLAIGGSGGADPKSAETYNTSSGSWTLTGSMTAERYSGFTATLLADGRVLVEGGTFSAAASEVYNPATGTWSAGPTAASTRFRHTATLLPNGKVLIAGGGTASDGSSPSSVAQLYDPVSNTFTTTGSLAQARSGHSATLLPNGKVVVIGGLGTSSTLSSVEIYDPAAGTWSTSTASLATARKYHTATLLADGRVVIVGGSSSADAALASVEIFASNSPAWSATGTKATTGAAAQPVMLPDGKILVLSGGNPNPATADLYNPATGTWSSAGTMVSGHSEGTATLMPNGKVLLAGHTTIDAANKSELYDPVAGTWTALPNMPSSRIRQTATLLASGKVLITGGGLPAGLTASLLFDPATNSWSTSGSLATGRLWHTATSLPNGKVLVTGGASQFAMDSFGSCELYDAAVGTWSTVNAMAETRQRHSATLLPNGKVLVVGGMYVDWNLAGTFTPRATAELFDPATGTWSTTGPLATARYDHRAALLPDGRVLVAGGTGTSAALSSTEIYNPATGTWSSGPTLSSVRTSPILTLLATGKVLIAGGSTGTTSLNTAELLDLGLGFNSAWQPQVTTASINGGRVLSITGTALRGISGGSSGGTQDSATDFPRVQLRSLGNAQMMWARPTSSSATGFTSTALGAFAPGHLLMTVFTNGIPSESKVLTLPLGPEIAVEQPVGTNIADGGSQSFGSLTNGTSTPLTFTVKNSGDGALSLTGVSVTGGNAADFVVNSTGMSSSVAAGGSTTFMVTFTPSAVGSRSTTLQILSDDYDEATFDITLTGTGVNAVPTISDIADQTIDEDVNTGALAFTIGDFETAASSLTVTRASSDTTLVPLANIVLGGSGASRTVTVTPAANLSGTAIITVTVSDGTVSTSDTFNLTVNAVNDAPTLNSITNPAAISEDNGLQFRTLSGIGAGGGESQTLTVTATSDNAALIPTPSVTYTSPNTTGSVLYTPVANMSGTATITVTVNDGQAANNTFSRTFLVTVNAVNDSPTLDVITSPAAINEDAGQQTINLTGITAGPFESQMLVVTATSNNTGLIPHPTVSYTTPNTTGALTYTPVADANGSATITVTVNDQQASNNTFSRTFSVTVNAVNDAPTITDITDQAINEDGNTGALAFTIGDLETAASSLAVTHSSSNTTLVPGANVVFGGSGASRTVTFTPAANQSGTAIITMTVSDGTTTTSDTFNLTVNAVNDPPTLNSITSPGTIQEDAVQQTVLLSGISAGPNESQTLMITATSNNTALIPNPTVSYASPGTTGSVLYTPVANMSGTATITVTVNDGQVTSNTISQTFNVIVNAVNDAPTLDPISNPAAILEDATQQVINLSGITSGPLEAQGLIITASSNNPGVILNPAVQYTHPSSTGTLTYTPVANASGTATITVTVNDQQVSNNTISRTFTVTVTAVNDAPVISDIFNTNTSEDGSSGVMNFTVGDLESGPDPLTLTGSSSNTTLVPNGNIVFGGSGQFRTVNVTPAANQSGTATITATASDGELSSSDTFVITVSAVNDAPTLDAIASPAAIAEDSGLQTIHFSGITAGPLEEQTLLVTATSSNTSLIPHPTVSYTSPNTTGSLSYTPVANANGSATITVTVSDQQASNNTFSRTFTVTVNAVNDAPTISDIADQAVNEDASTGAVVFSVNDLDTDVSALSVTGISSNTALVPNSNIVFGGSGGSRSVTLTPAPDQNGTSIITVTVSDGQYSSGDTFVLTVNPTGEAPSGSNKTVTVAAGSSYSFQVVDWGFSDPDDSPPNAFAGVVLSSLPGLGVLHVNGTPATAGLRVNTSGQADSIWTPRESSRPWVSITSSADGSKLAAVELGFFTPGQIYTSADFGATWTPRGDDGYWGRIAMSADGSKLAAAFSSEFFSTAEPTGRIHTSTDYGMTWTPRGNVGNWGSVASSADGSKLAAADLDQIFFGPNTPIAGKLAVSTDFGVSWTVMPTHAWQQVVSSASGSHLAGIAIEYINTYPFAYSATRIFTSSDAGVTWTRRTEDSYSWSSITCSADGSRLAAVVIGGQIHVSSDYGATWTTRESNREWTAITSSADGSKLAAVVRGGQIYVSNDFGVTWSAKESPRQWNAITSSADGRRLAAVDYNGQIYTSDSMPAITYVAPATPGSTSFTFQVEDDGASSNLDLTPNTMTIHVVSQPDFWRQTHFGSTSNSGNGGDLADPDGDGVPNLLEYALGLHPGQNSAGQMPQAVRSGGDLIYTFTEPAGVTGITYIAEWSETLQTGSWSSAGITHTVNNRVHTFTLPVGASPGAFIRLRVTTP
ncbi:MAG: tandem-95 repeat protein [Verrucomicrobiaceae bacterium]|nr:tandem-95 repeat protein [Verrucomicrobiaceae bacterium]